MKVLELGKFSLGVGDRFGREAAAQLQACQMAARQGVEIIPVWNKSNREHCIIGSEPMQTRAAADAAVKSLGWTAPYHVDADHIGLKTVDRFIPCCDFFTIDVADSIGRAAEPEAIEGFVKRHQSLCGAHRIAGLRQGIEISPALLRKAAGKYLLAVEEAGRVYRHIEPARNGLGVIIEISMDETDEPQTPEELLIILAAVADERIPIQTIAPKFIGRFNKGVDYVGDVAEFERQFNDDLAVLAYAVRAFGLPSNLKLSVHSGSDKFSIYGPIRRGVRRFNTGLHVKTAGTTWLEEIIGLAEGGGPALEFAKELYANALQHMDELCAPYATVIDIDRKCLPPPGEVAHWKADRFASALRHDRGNTGFNPHLRQLLHVGYKLAAQRSDRFLALLDQCRQEVSRNVTANLFERHVKPLFLDKD